MAECTKSDRLKGDVAVVTGAASGLDRGIALELARNGAVVACMDINDAENDKTVQLIKDAGGEAFAVHLDIGDSASVDAAFKQVHDRCGKITVFVHGAAIAKFTQLPECTNEEWELVMRINLTGAFYCLRALHPYMKPTGGRVVLISSTSAKSGGSWAGAHYVASKAGILGLTRYAAGYFVKDNIRVNSICPGVSETPLVTERYGEKSEQTEKWKSSLPMERMCTPEDVAGAVMFLVSSESSYVTGTSIDVTGGRYIYNN